MEQLNSSVVPSNISSSPGHPYPASWVSTGLIPAMVLVLCFLLGVPGNIAVIIIRPNWQHLSILSQRLMLNLAISDLLCLLTLPLWIYTLLQSWTIGLVTCKILAYLIYCCLYSSLLTVTALSVQRYLLVVYPQRCFNQVGRRRLLVLLWLVAMILSVPALVVRQLTTDQNWTNCEAQFSSPAQQMAVLLTESLPGFVSIIVVVFAYITLHRKVNQAAFFNNPQTTRLVTSIIVTFFVLWVPYHITNVLGVAAISIKNDGLLKFCEDSWSIVGALVFVNSCLNPLLYAFASRNMCTLCRKREHTVNADGPLQEV
ncbi:leukotriene B4 receptor 1-like [Sebastes fasciatus]|uniref:leukotriene B4 receptor 1-like n=1 Tax=Sebastes fasciatus TaxID=394691 RepID=UPI003D9E46ED